MRGTRALLRTVAVGAIAMMFFAVSVPHAFAGETNYLPASPPGLDTYLGPLVFAAFQGFASGIFQFSTIYGDNDDVLKNKEPGIKNPPMPAYPPKGGESGFIMWCRP